ncbi:MAG: TetR/AcrR family transcriptional regulator [Candidatus Dormibacteria bacterium]
MTPGSASEPLLTRKEQAQRTRDDLIGAGLRLAERTGLSGMSVNLLIREAGVSKGSFFHHFGDRATYLLALHRGFHDRLLAEIQKAIAGLPPGRRRLLAASATYLDVCLRDRGVRALLLEARAEALIAAEVLRRNEENAKLCRADFQAMGWKHPLESARLWVGLVAEGALIELGTGARRPAVRAALKQFLGEERLRSGRPANALYSDAIGVLNPNRMNPRRIGPGLK